MEFDSATTPEITSPSIRREAKEDCIRELRNAIERRDFREVLAVRQRYVDRIRVSYIGLTSISTLDAILGAEPSILKSCSKKVLGELQVAAAISCVISDNRGGKFLPEGLTTGLKMDNDAAVRMVIFSVMEQRNIASWTKSRVVESIQMRCPAVNEGEKFKTCDRCRVLEGRIFRLESPLPELPYEHCESVMGCRCFYQAVV